MNDKLWGENGDYIGYKIGKPWFENHGSHIPIEIKMERDFIVVCETCKKVTLQKVVSYDY